MLLIEIKRIPPEGLDIDEAIDPASVHLEAEADFSLHPGGGFRGRVEFVDGDTVHVNGRLASPLEVECGRCLERYPFPVDARLDLFFLKHRPQQPEEQEEDVRLDDRDVVVGYYEGDVLDLGDVVREQLVLSLPLKRLCREDCRGLCPVCGSNRNRQACSCSVPEEPVDPRLEGLRRLLDPDRQ